MARVVVAMSGGVDSSVSAYLIKQQGHEVIGLFMKNWDEIDEQGHCPAEADYEDVAAVCAALDIPYYSVNFTQEYRQKVFEDFLRDYKAGATPNPDILCNKEIKFKVLWEKAQGLGADYLATGHYCRVLHEEGQSYLLKGLDPEKDQSYFLYAIDPAILSRVLFPVGELHKKEVRSIAKALNLKTHAKKDSTGICFIGERDFRQFLSQYVAITPGPIIEWPSGKVVGKHQGIAFYTIGQRKGLQIGGAGEAWFVAGKNKDKNELYVVQGADHPALFSTGLWTEEFYPLTNKDLSQPIACSAKIRYRHPGATCLLQKTEGGYRVDFNEPQRAVTPRQSVVFYQGDLCLGGGIIRTSIGSLLPPL
jgi:tRNA-specific 2-thiouridylase